jgi:hypothetical protein
LLPKSFVAQVFARRSISEASAPAIGSLATLYPKSIGTPFSARRREAMEGWSKQPSQDIG